MAFGCLADFGRKFLIALNTVFLFLALAVLVIGALVKYGKNAMGSIMDSIVGGINSMSGSAGLGNFDLSNIDIGAMVGGAAVAFIIVGIVLVGVAAFGMYGAKKKLRCALIMYTIVIAAIIIAELAFIIIIMTMRQKIDGALKGPMKTMLTSQYAGINGSDVVSQTWNFLMLNFHCCGVEDFADFRNSVFWNRKYKINSNETITMEIPITCCKSPEKVKENIECLVNPNKDNSNFLQGCYEALWSEINNNSGLMIGIMTTVAVFELLLIYFAVLVSRAITKDNKEKKNENKNESDDSNDEKDDSNKKNKRKKSNNKDNKTTTTTTTTTSTTSAIETVADALNRLIIEPQLAAQGQGQCQTAHQTQVQSLLGWNSILGHIAGVGDGNVSNPYSFQNIQQIPNVLQPFVLQAANPYLSLASPISFPAQAAISQIPNVQTLQIPIKAASSQSAQMLNYPFVSGSCSQSNMQPYIAHHGSSRSGPPGIIDATEIMCTNNNTGYNLKPQMFENNMINTPPPPYSGRCPKKSLTKRVSISDDIQSSDISGCNCKRSSICVCVDDINSIKDETELHKNPHSKNEVADNRPPPYSGRHKRSIMKRASIPEGIESDNVNDHSCHRNSVCLCLDETGSMEQESGDTDSFTEEQVSFGFIKERGRSKSYDSSVIYSRHGSLHKGESQDNEDGVPPRATEHKTKHESQHGRERSMSVNDCGRSHIRRVRPEAPGKDEQDKARSKDIPHLEQTKKYSNFSKSFG